MAIDINRIAAAAAQSYLDEHRRSVNGRVREGGKWEGGGRRLRGVGAVALGVGLAVAARAVYSRARSFDLERAAGKVEDRLSG